MVRNDEYAIFALHTYPGELENRPKLPLGWTQIGGRANDSTGFSANAYRNDTSGEVVIAYTGTNGYILLDTVMANVPAATGWYSPQIREAIEFYSDIAAQAGVNPASISFTGHSLGGGLASLMSVYFNRPAVTFAEAPFGYSALFVGGVQSYFDSYQQYQLRHSRASNPEFAVYVQEVVDQYYARQEQITNFAVNGEFLAIGRAAGNTLVGHDFVIEHAATDLGGGQLHSMALHAMAMASEAFGAQFLTTPYLADVLLDSKLYSHSRETIDPDFMVRMLYGHALQNGTPTANGPLNQFATELSRLGTGATGDTSLRRGLMATLMEYYYFKLGTDISQLPAEFIQQIANGIRFDPQSIVNSDGKGRAELLAGLEKYISENELLTGDDRKVLKLAVEQARGAATWFVQAGSAELTTVGSELGDVFIGGDLSDTFSGGAGGDFAYGGLLSDGLAGGSGDDLLFGGGGNDTLAGGVGFDRLYGGESSDTYLFFTGDQRDSIVDADGGVLRVNNVALTGTAQLTTVNHRNAWELQAGGNTFTLRLVGAASLNNGALTIVGDGLAETDLIRLADFYQADSRFGFTLNSLNRVKSLTGSSALRESGAKTVVVKLAGVAEVGNVVRLTVDSSVASKLKVYAGNVSYDFQQDGSALIPLTVGNDTFVYSLVFQGDVDLDTQFNITAALGSTIGQAVDPTVSSLSTLVRAYDETVLAAPSTDHVRVGTSAGDVFFGPTDPPGNYSIQGLGGDDLIDASELIVGANDPPGNDILDGGDGNDSIYGWTGNDRLIGGAGIDNLRGEDGDDVIEAGVGADFATGGTGTNWLYADSQVAIDVAIAAGQTATSDAGQGDFLQDGAGDGVIVGSSRQDVLAGASGADMLVGGGGDDLIAGDSTYDMGLVNGQPYDFRDIVWNATFTNGTGPGGEPLVSFQIHASVGGNSIVTTQTVWVPGGDDVIYSGTGNDGVVAGGGNDFVDGGIGNDVIFGDGGNDTLFGASGDDVMSGDGDAGEAPGDDYVSGGDGNDRVDGGDGSDSLYGGADNDIMLGDNTEAGAGDDYMSGGTGADKMWGGARSDILSGDAGNDELYGDDQNTTIAAAGDDFLLGGEGDDLLVGFGGEDTLFGEAGDDRLLGHGPGSLGDDEAEDYLSGGAGADTLWGWGGADLLAGDDGDDTIYGDDYSLIAALHGADEIDGGAGDDVIYGQGGDDLIAGGEGNDYLDGDFDTSTAFVGDDVLDGGNGGDSLHGGAGKDQLIGGEGNDYLLGDDGDDTLTGGAGQDYMQGGAGDDTYVFNAGDMEIVDGIGDGISDMQGRNHVTINSGLNFSEVWVYQGTGAGTVNLANLDFSAGIVISSGFNGAIDSIEFSDGVSISMAQLLGTKLYSSTWQEAAGSGTSLYGGRMDDHLDHTGADITLSGGMGNDVLIHSGLGGATYLFNRGDGHDTVVDQSTFEQSNGVESNVLVLGENMYAEEISIRISAGTGMTLDLGHDDRIALSSFSLSDPLNGARTFDEIRFADRPSMSWEQLLNYRGVDIGNGTGATSFSGTQFNDRITGAATAETVDAGAGDDRIDGGGGNDVLTGGAGSDTYIFKRGMGDDRINNADSASGKIDRLEIEADISLSEVNFVRVGASLIVRLGTSSDKVFIADFFAGTGLDEIRFNSGPVFTPASVPWIDGSQNLLTYARGEGFVSRTVSDASGTIVDILRFATGITPNSVRLSSNSQGDLVIRFIDANGAESATDQLTIIGAVANPAAVLDRIEFTSDPATLWTTSDQLAMVRVPTRGNDYIFGSTGADVLSGLWGGDTIQGDAGDDDLSGGAGRDDLRGGSGNDTLRGGKDSDYLQGDGGSDTFRIERGDNWDGISGFDTAPESVDRVVFGPGILPADVRVMNNNPQLVLTIVDPVSGTIVNKVLVENYFSAQYEGQTIDEIRFVDAPGTVWLRADIERAALLGGAQSDGLTGYATNDVLSGQGGDDGLAGLAGDDDLDGGSGNDFLSGGEGNDIYRYGPNGGADVISETSGTDRIVLASGIAAADIQLYRHSGSLVLVLNGSQHQLTVSDAYNVSGNKSIESIEFANGTVWDAATIAANTIDLTGTANVHTGTAAGDVFVVDHSSDSIIESVSGGVDTVQSSVAYALPTNVENLTLTGLVNISGFGNELANVITGNANRNQLDGGAGADTLVGGLGDDTYVVEDAGGSTFNSGWSDGTHDTVVENANGGYDTVIVKAYSATLNANVERLVGDFFSGSFSSFSAGDDRRRRFVGNDLDNVIDATLPGTVVPNSNGIYLDGGLGADLMIGGLTNDTFVVDNVGDLVSERGLLYGGEQGSGDTVISSISYTLTENVEGLQLTGSNAINGTGNDLNNTLDGTTSTAANVLTGRDGDDTYRLGIGDTVVENSDEGTDSVLFVAGEATYSLASLINVERFELDASTGASNVLGSSRNDYIQGNSGANTLEGGAGHDIIRDGMTIASGWSGADSDILRGGDGNDTLRTQYGLDILDGGAGDDMLEERGFSQSRTMTTFMFGRNYGHDTISTSVSNLAASNITLLAGIDSSEVTLSRDGTNLLLHIAGDSGSLRVLDFFTSTTGYGVSGGMIYEIRFADGTLWDITRMVAYIRAADGATPTAGDDALVGTSGNDSIDALAGNDTVYGEGGDDALAGSDGTDTLWGGNGNDSLVGGEGQDTLWGEKGNDVLTGGAYFDYLYGGAGADTYRFGVGASSIGDVIDDSGSAPEDGSIDEIVFEAGINPSDIRLTNTWTETFRPDLQVSNLVTEEYIVVRDFFAAEHGGVNDRIEQIRFADGTIWDINEILNQTSQLIGTAGDDFLQASSSATRIYGLAGNDTLRGGAGNDLLDGGPGGDSMQGNNGNDTYEVDSASDSVVEDVLGGTDLVRSSVNFTLGSEVENLTLTGTSSINGTGNGLVNIIIGNSFNNTLNGMGGADTLAGGLGNDTYEFDGTDVITENAGEGTDLVRTSGTHTLAANFENLTLLGSGTANATGNDSVNVIVGNSGANVIDGGLGADDMTGGSGNDTFIVDNAGDIVRESSGSGTGTDIVLSSVTIAALAANVENLTLTGAGLINGTGNTANNFIVGNSAANTLNAGTAGTDTLQGGGGDDIYVVDHTGVTVTEATGEGTDLVQSTVTFTLGNNVENLTITGSSTTVVATGNGLDNVITGSSVANTLNGGDGNDTLNGLGGSDTLGGGNGNDILDGGTGNDGMTGGAGDDTYFVDSGTDVVTEASGGGTDTIQTTLQFTGSLVANVENLTLLGSIVTGAGNTLNNLIIGNAANNTIDGQGGADQMRGGAGNDTYTVDNTGDTVVENAAEGIDTVNTSVNFTLGANVENLTITGSSTTVVATGNGLDNVITGSSVANTLNGGDGNDTLNGGGGNDTMSGGLGDDVYSVNVSGDVVTETANQGTDTIQSSIAGAFTLNTTALANVENLTLLTGGTNATGNALANALTGNSASNTLTGMDGNDTLNGMGGTDTLVGGLGNDIYVVDTTTDVITETSGQGTDTVQSSVTFTLNTTPLANTENLTLTGTGVINGTGNALANVLTGNSVNNSLDGGSGDDTLNGMGGTDALTGGLGADTYQYNSGGGIDTINNVAGDSLIDRLRFLDLASDQVTFTRSGGGTGADLIATVTGGGSVTVTGWFSATANRLDFVNFTNVEKTAAQIDALIAGGGGSFPLNVPPPAAMRVAPELELGSAFAAWGAWDGSPVGETTGERSLNASKSNTDQSMLWRPIKSFSGDLAGAATLGSKSAGEGLNPTWRPIKSFVRDDASVGVERLVDAMAKFGVERTVDAVSHIDRSHSEALELLSAQHATRSQQIRSAIHAMMD